MKAKGGFPVNEGDKLIVLRFSDGSEWLAGAVGAGLPAGPAGSYRARVVEGKSKGAIVVVPGGNLIADQPETAKKKSRQKQ